MPTAQTNGKPDPLQQPAGGRKGTRRKSGANPIGTTPYGDTGSPQSLAASDLIAAFQPAIDSLQAFQIALGQAIADGLNTALSEVKAIQQGLMTTIGCGFTPGLAAQAQFAGDLTQAIGNQMNTAAEYASA